MPLLLSRPYLPGLLKSILNTSIITAGDYHQERNFLFLHLPFSPLGYYSALQLGSTGTYTAEYFMLSPDIPISIPSLKTEHRDARMARHNISLFFPYHRPKQNRASPLLTQSFY